MLARLRALAPQRPLSLPEALKVAELQAAQLLALRNLHLAPVPSEVVADLRRISVEYDFDMPDQISGASDWDHQRKRWVITINALQPDTRQRFTLLHEYKHILDHGHPGLAVQPERRYYGLPAPEFVADYFAGCVLMPRPLVLRAWNQGLQEPADLAVRFDVSERAMEVRLSQLRLISTGARQLDRHGMDRGGRAA